MRKLVKAAAALTAGCMLLSTSAFAMTSDLSTTAENALTNGAIDVNIEGLGAGQSTIIVLKGNTALADASEDNILYINQTAISETGTASYNVNLGADFTGTATVYAGGTNETATTLGVLKGIVSVTDLTLVSDKAELEFGDVATLTATVIPADATDKTVEWTGDVTDVTVDAENANIVTAKFTAPEVDEDTDYTITAKAGDVTKSVTIKVKAKVEVPAGDYIASTGEAGKATVTSKTKASVGNTWSYGDYVSIETIVLDGTAYANVGDVSMGYSIVVVDNNNEVITGAPVFYSVQRSKYIALIPENTGYKYQVIAGGNTNTKVDKYGDVLVNAQNAINTSDSALTTRAIKGLMSLSDLQKISADVVFDGKINTSDSAAITRFAKGLMTKFPIENQ